jgi:DNA-binding MarR family transcriptional regulator
MLKYVIKYDFIMNQVNLAHDPDGTLFDARVRTAMSQFTQQKDTDTFEAAASVRTAYHALERLRSHGTDSRGLSSGALDVLIRLSALEDGSKLSALATAAGVSARNITGLVDTLERDGLVERIPDPTDRRSVLAKITTAGQEWLKAFRRPSQLAMTAMFRDFTPTEVTQLRHLCLRLVENQTLIEQHLAQ